MRFQQLPSIMCNFLVYMNLVLCVVCIMCHLFFCAFFVLTDASPVTLRTPWKNVFQKFVSLSENSSPPVVPSWLQA